MIESEVSEMIVHAKEVGSIIIGAVEEDEGRPQLSDMAAYWVRVLYKMMILCASSEGDPN